MDLSNYNEFLSSTKGIKSGRAESGFNDVVFSTEFILGLKELNMLNHQASFDYIEHLQLNADEHGLYKPKNSHDNLTAKLAGCKALMLMDELENFNLKEACRRKHPRDIILYNFLMRQSWWSRLLLPLALLDMIRAIKVEGKVRPVWYKDNIWFRFKAKFGFQHPTYTEEVFAGRVDYYDVNDKERGLLIIQNDGKLLNLLRLNMLREYKYLKPFVRYCKKLYIRRYGECFQTVLFSNYFREYDHPIRELYRFLDGNGKTIIDC